VKVTPNNQTLILASERGMPAGRSSAKLDSDFDLDSASTGAVLKRVTIVAARPDTTLLYLRADYSSQSDAATDTTPSYSADTDAQAASDEANSAGSALITTTAPRQSLVAASGAPRDSYGNIQGSKRETGFASYLSPTDQYARTQRILSDEPEYAHIDVHA
jgi:hypothetical protein